MKKQEANQLAKMWNQFVFNKNPRTATVAKVEKNAIDYSVEICPAEGNDGRAFHPVEELADIVRVFRAHSYISLGYDEDFKEIVVARVF